MAKSGSGSPWAEHPRGVSRHLVISDLHLGHADALLSRPQALERLEPELERADVLVLNGDVFDFLVAPLEECADAGRPLFELAGRLVERIIYVPGNHDYHFVAHEEDRARFAAITGGAEQKPFRLQTAEWVLSSLAGGRCEVRAYYPQAPVAGATVMHGHYTDPHLGGFGHRLAAKVSRRLAGITTAEPDLRAADYEALIAPLTELLYRSAQLPGSRRTWRHTERALVFTAALIHAPRLLRRTLASWRRGSTEQPDELAEWDIVAGPFALITPEEAREAMRHVFANLGLQAGEYLIGHTHVPFAPLECGPHTLANSGAWLYDRRHARHPAYRRAAWPGTALRKELGRPAELVSLLGDGGERELVRWLDGARAKRGRRFWRRPRHAG